MTALPDCVATIPGAVACRCQACGVALEIGSWCEPCLVADERRRHRRTMLDSMTVFEGAPSWPWARVSDPLFAQRVRVVRFQKFAANWTPDKGNVKLAGPSGSGKTAAMRACVDNLVGQALKAADSRLPICRSMWTSAHGLLRAIREHRLGAGPAPVLDSATYSPILFLDEVGQGRGRARRARGRSAAR